MIATTQDQSQRLLRCGVSSDTADMSIRTITAPMMCEDVAWQTPMLLTLTYSEAKDIYRGDDITPAWSLSSLLDVLPKEPAFAVGAYPDSDRYACFTLIDPDIEPIVADTAIEAVVRMIEQLDTDPLQANVI